MTTFDWSLLLPRYAGGSCWACLAASECHRDSGHSVWRPWHVLVYRKCIRNIEVVYKDLYIEEIYKDNSRVPPLYHMFIQFNLRIHFNEGR